jgi:sugar/nucleoside kinase (ribokinase family)
MIKNLDIVVVGELNVDLILTGLPSLPEMGNCILSKDMHFTLGSASAIFASNISRLGLKVGFVGKIGDDEFGDFILNMLAKTKVDTSQIIREKKAKTGICVSLSFPDNYAMASYAGVRETLCLSDINMNYLSGARHLHMSSYYLQSGMQKGAAELFRKAKSLGLTTSLDPDSDPSGLWDESIYEVLKYVDIFLPNGKEARHISKCDSIEHALDHLKTMVKTVVIKDGEDGAWVRNKEKTIHAKAFNIKVVDTTGAGDSFNSGFIYQFYKGSSLEDCALWGNACAAISTTEPGGTTAFPDLLQLGHFFAGRKAEAGHLIKIIK